MKLVNDYFDSLKKRSIESRIYRAHQLVGLEIAALLDDSAHLSLYMKLAKEFDSHELLALAKRVVEQKNIKNRGAYFMKMLKTYRPSAPSHD